MKTGAEAYVERYPTPDELWAEAFHEANEWRERFDGKDYFTIYDFVKAYEHFNDPEWDGEPMEPVAAQPVKPEDNPDAPKPEKGEGVDEGKKRPETIRIKLADGKDRLIQSMMATTYWSPDGKPISANQMIEKLFGELPRFFKDEDELRALWSQPETRKALLQALSEAGFGQDWLGEVAKLINAEKSDVFDVLAYVAYAKPPISRQERAETRKGVIFGRYDDRLRAFLDFVLAQYVSQGTEELDREKLGALLDLKYGSVNDAIAALGEGQQIADTFIGFQRYLYDSGPT